MIFFSKNEGRKNIDEYERNGLWRRRSVKKKQTKSTKKLTKYLIATNLKCRLRLRNDKTFEKQFKEESRNFSLKI